MHWIGIEVCGTGEPLQAENPGKQDSWFFEGKDKMRKKRTGERKSGKRNAGRIAAVLGALYIGALTVPYIKHKEVPDTYKEQVQTKEYYSDVVGSERIAYIDDNSKALEYRLKMIDEAEEEVILSTFDFNADKSGRDMMAALLEAGDRGVQVKVLVDGISGFLDLRGNPWFQALASHEKVEIKVYNPVNVLKPWKLQARLHDKYLMIDEKMYLLGGRNTTNLFLGDYSKKKNIDRELFVYETEESEDCSLQQLRNYFESVWGLEDCKAYVCKKENDEVKKCRTALEARNQKLHESYPQAYTAWEWESKTIPANRITLLQNPIEAENKEPRLWYALSELMKQGDEVLVYTPYIICGREMYEDLESICSENEKTEIITNDVSSGANPWGCTDYLNQKEKIWGTGVKVYEFMGAHSSHTKAVLIDERMSIVGSYNLDMRSTYQDTELMLAVDCPELNEKIREEAERDKSSSRSMTEQKEYEYGENYEEKELSLGKKIFYLLLRGITIPVRRFL